MSSAFDYIIVGGGTAGLVLANRLSDDERTSVCILEAGEDARSKPAVHVPGLAPLTVADPEINWMFNSTPQASLNGKVVPHHRGRAIGGTSAINFILSGRASSVEYNAFESKLGMKGWNWSEFLKYFKKSETFTFDSSDAELYGLKDTNSHGTSGPLQRTLGIADPVNLKFFDALAEKGVPRAEDSNNGVNAGACVATGLIDPATKTRSFAANAYYDPVKDRANLSTITSARVTRVLLEKSGSSGKLRAVGVEYSKDGALHVVRANKEVVLSAGTYQSPQILELSGIGDKAVLGKHGINVLNHLPGVGTNLQDHWVSFITREIYPHIDSLDVMGDPERAAAEMQLYQTEKKGLLAGIMSMGYSWLTSPMFTDGEKLKKAAVATGKGNKSVEIVKDWLTDEAVPNLECVHVGGFWPLGGQTPEPGKKYFTIAVGLAHPLSRGTVHIGSSDPSAAPVIDDNVFSNPVDVDIVVEGLKFARKVADAEVLKDIVKEEALPGPKVQTDEELAKWAKETSTTMFHPLGTAAMMPLEDGGVVDAECRVYGTENLRVVDASILPFHLSTHIQMTVYALAEKAADIIKSA